MPRCPEVKIGDKQKEMEKLTECTIEQRLISKNPYTVLEEDNDIISNDVITNSVSETEITILTVTEWITTQSDIVQL